MRIPPSGIRRAGIDRAFVDGYIRQFEREHHLVPNWSGFPGPPANNVVELDVVRASRTRQQHIERLHAFLLDVYHDPDDAMRMAVVTAQMVALSRCMGLDDDDEGAP
jgi:hypothetical protein